MPILEVVFIVEAKKKRTTRFTCLINSTIRKAPRLLQRRETWSIFSNPKVGHNAVLNFYFVFLRKESNASISVASGAHFQYEISNPAPMPV